MLCARDTVAKNRMNLFQRVACLITSGEIFTSVTISARAFNQVPDFEIKPVLEATVRWIFLNLVGVPLNIIGGTAILIIISVPRSHESHITW